jgi:hypothetical protein
MNSSSTATVETLTAEVRVLMVGNRQITLSVFRQLDPVRHDQIEPFGRVRSSDKLSHLVQVVGCRTAGPHAGTLVRSWLNPEHGSYGKTKEEFRAIQDKIRYWQTLPLIVLAGLR